MKKAMIMLLLATAAAQAQQPADSTRLDKVVERGKQVMPFNLEKTLHIFDKTETGGVQQVVATNANDAEQIHLVRQHLSAIAARFSKGDFSGPKQIHGDDMPGVAELSAGADRIRFDYQDLPNGGQIEYRSTDPQLITAVHSYFDAQLKDHARHAVPGKQGMHHGHQ